MADRDSKRRRRRRAARKGGREPAAPQPGGREPAAPQPGGRGAASPAAGTTRTAPSAQQPTTGQAAGAVHPLVRAGRYAWAVVGLLLVAVAVTLAAGRLSTLVVPLVLALFPAALLWPLARWLQRHRVPGPLASLLTILAALAVIAGAVTALVPLVRAEIPELSRSVDEGMRQLDRWLSQAGLGVGGLAELVDRAREALGQAGNIAGRALAAVTAVFEVAAGVMLGLVALFFYLYDGPRFAAAIHDLLPAKARPHAGEIGARAWETLGGYFRGQLLIALFDAVLIGIGLAVLRVPLALPLAVLVFVGGMFPIVGAVVSGALAVLVALAASGPAVGLAVLAIVAVVQQLEGNLLAPLVLGKAIKLHPFVIIAALTAGGILLGILGAFLAVPVAASVARAVDYLRERD